MNTWRRTVVCSEGMADSASARRVGALAAHVAGAAEPAVDSSKVLDVAVVGGGAWGLSVTKLLRDAGLDVCCVERGELCQNLRTYMRRMTMHYPTPYMVVEEADDLLAKGSDQ